MSKAMVLAYLNIPWILAVEALPNVMQVMSPTVGLIKLLFPMQYCSVACPTTYGAWRELLYGKPFGDVISVLRRVSIYIFSRE
jgi:hypothetical protein